jgi:hypothetical protein
MESPFVFLWKGGTPGKPRKERKRGKNIHPLGKTETGFPGCDIRMDGES